MATENAVRFLNIDLIITGTFDREPLLQALGDRVFVLHEDAVVGPHQRCLLLEVTKPHLDLEATLAYLLEWVQHLPRSARRSWAAAARRVFDIGIQAGLQPHETHWTIPPNLIRGLDEVGAEVIVTVYGARSGGRAQRRSTTKKHAVRRSRVRAGQGGPSTTARSGVRSPGSSTSGSRSGSVGPTC